MPVEGVEVRLAVVGAATVKHAVELVEAVTHRSVLPGVMAQVPLPRLGGVVAAILHLASERGLVILQVAGGGKKEGAGHPRVGGVLASVQSSSGRGAHRMHVELVEGRRLVS